MTLQQQQFCDEYLIDFNATQAAIRAGYKENTAYSQGQRLLKNVEVREYMQKRMKKREKRTEITQDMVVNELAKIAFLDISKLYDENGMLKKIQDIDKDSVKAISSLETLEEYSGYGEDREKIGDTRKVRLLDKTKALELLGKHLGLFTDIKLNITNSDKLKDVFSQMNGKGLDE